MYRLKSMYMERRVKTLRYSISIQFSSSCVVNSHSFRVLIYTYCTTTSTFIKRIIINSTTRILCFLKIMLSFYSQFDIKCKSYFKFT